ncbi:hypothetical protein WJX84_009792 [Apatococcus fuscideae]|uniref:Uncharacterized protein n=1 Tax=Apatococcus fuscideae TaxID=2026836 RepID=A0AAW1SU32_9CHLO
MMQVYAWGWGRYVQMLGMEPEKTVRGGIGLPDFGWNKYGQLGHGNTEDEIVPRQVETLSKRRIQRIAGGWRHTIAGDDQGPALWAFGWNKFGQLGLARHEDAPLPEAVKGLAGHQMTQLACGWRHSLAVSSKGQVFAWGRGGNGQLGLGWGHITDQFTPQRVDCLSLGTMKLERFQQPLQPTTDYVAPADRYAVVPNQRPSQANGCLAVPQVVPTCRQDRTNDVQQPPAQTSRVPQAGLTGER